jgi:formate hydrogenlyase transcriptional activator
MNETGPFAEIQPPAWSPFESLLAELCDRFVSVRVDQMDAAIEEAQRAFCEHFGLDRSKLFQCAPPGGSTLVLTHVYQLPGLPSPLFKKVDSVSRSQVYWRRNGTEPGGGAVEIDGVAIFPWFFAQLQRGHTVVVPDTKALDGEATVDKEFLAAFQTRSTVAVPLFTGGVMLGVLTFSAVRERRQWNEGLVKHFHCLANVFTNALARKRAEESLRQALVEIQRLKECLQTERDYLRTEIKLSHSFEEIIGQSKAIKNVLHQIEQAAPADCPVLILGETGTGKELIARAVHRLSSRNARAIIKVNCAALQATLVESELFGRERGAFTGAITSQAGRFELADGSTIFLDEIGELSPEVQAKLLRVLQEGEFERLGSPRVRKVDVRIIAATNRNLAEEVRKGRFRQDLYYRLSVFPIKVPSLRERTEDIPALVSAFVAEFSSRMGRKITRIPRSIMDALERHSWPGNIRELRNILEHGIILSADDVLRLPGLGDLEVPAAHPTTLAANEREHILRIIEKAGGRIKGTNGAANLLGMNPATLYSRMKKLGIPGRRQRDDISAQG